MKGLILLLVVALPQAAVAAETKGLASRILKNKTAYIPPQCYTKTEGADGRVHNPCYVCHTRSRRPNFVNDADLQLVYSFPLPAERNPWKNLFVDRRDAAAAITDKEITDYIHTSNYFDAEGGIKPAKRLREVPTTWDFNGDGTWQGFVPDAWFNFDDAGFDRSPSGDLTGWRAFAYYPFPGTFWPTNGSTDDVLIRLPKLFRRDSKGKFDIDVYKTNLAIVEAMIREQDVAIAPVDEAALGGVDLDGDGSIGKAQRIHYDWKPLEGRQIWYVGQANTAQQAGKVHIAAGLYPEGTEFLHTVRYIDVKEDGTNRLAPRIKEVRYARKAYWKSYAAKESYNAHETKEEHDFPDRPRFVHGNLETGVSNDQGWLYAGMIEDAQGELRPQSYEELVFCVGCHSGIGATTDASFAFPRKLTAEQYRGGWYHWSQRDQRGLPEPLRQDGQPEFAFYLTSNGAGDELRSNTEVLERFFGSDGKPRQDALRRLRHDITQLLYASPARALQLNKAYRVIVADQSFAAGRDPTLTPMRNVHERVDGDTATGVREPLAGH